MKQFAFLLFTSMLVSCSLDSKLETSDDYLKYVNPFVGAAEFGHCFPGACVPFGLIQAGPETGNCSWAYCSGYQSTDSTINGFSQTRLNGTGCPDLGDILMLPFTGDATRPSYKSGFSRDQEWASPGFYSVVLTDFDIKADITASEHGTVHRYTYQGEGQPQLLIDFQSAMVFSARQLHTHVLDCRVEIENPTTITGYIRTNVWLERTYYFTINFNRPFTAEVELPKQDKAENAPRHVFSFDIKKGESLMVKVGISSTGVDSAIKNLQAEIPEWDFDNVHQAARAKWNDLLSRVKTEGTDTQKNIFYTSMYHLFIQPNNIADAGDETFYSTLSLWDTYRAAHPLYTIISPERVDGFVNSMLHQYDKQGFLPIWALWGGETYCMIANHAVPVIVDAYLKGFNGFDAERAYEAVKTSLTKSHLNSDWETYDKYGYYPFDIVKLESVSRTLESAYDDYCAARFAEALGKTEDAAFFDNRAGYYKNLFDKETNLMRGKDSKGNWRTPFNSFSLSHAFSSGGDYTEGNAWQYTWHVQHDSQGLIELMGGPEMFTAKLDSLFTMSEEQEGRGNLADVTGLIGQYAHGNEPSHHVSYLYTLAGKPWRTQELVNQICNTKYQDEINGLCGNDDCGQMSAWYIFSSLGFYPLNPCGGEFVIGAPQLPKVTINLQNGKTFTVIAENYSPENIYVRSVELNGVKHEKNTLTYNDIMNGGELKFKMSNTK